MRMVGRAMLLVMGIGLGVFPGAGPSQGLEARSPRVVVSILPVHSLVAAVMAGIGEPALLVKGGASPHTASLRPSGASALQAADVVFWVGNDLETFLAKPLAALPERAEVVPLASASGVRLLPVRKGGAWSSHEHDPGHGESPEPGREHVRGSGGLGGAGEQDAVPGKAADMHIWLDPENAKAIAAAVAAALAKADPTRAADYAANGSALRQRLDALDRELRGQLQDVAAKPYIVFHDAYQYFEARYGLNPVGAITVSPERAPGARTLSEIRERIRSSGAVCVFREPQFEPGLVRTVVAGSTARVGILDPLGAEIPPGPDAYPILLSRLATSLRACLLP